MSPQHPTRRQFIQGAAATAGVLTLGPTLWTRPGWAQAAPPGSPRLTFGADPKTEMSISWSTPEPVGSPKLSYGLDSTLGSTIDASTDTVLALPKPVTTNYHHVRLTGLQPATTYHYRLNHAGGESEVFTFTTAPTGATPFAFTAFGDQGASSGGALVTSAINDIRPAFNLVAGDICYADGLGTGLVVDLVQFDANTWDEWFLQGAAAMRAFPWMPALGNHDMEPLTLPGTPLGYTGHDARLTLPQSGPARYVYAFRYGNVAVLALDANDVSVEIPTMADYTNGAQTSWLDQQLGALRTDPSIDFIVAYFHHCAYCTIDSHSSDGGVRSKWVPLFDKHNVDLVINGHNHGYERTTPIKANAVTADSQPGAVIRSDLLGTTYICAGAGGKSGNHFIDDENGQRVGYVSTGPAGDAVPLSLFSEPEIAPWSVARDLTLGNSFIRVDVTPPDGGGGYTSMAVTALAPGAVAVNALSAAAASTSVIDTVTLVRQRVVAAPTPAPADPAAQPQPAPAPLPRTGPALPATGGHDLLVPTALVAGAAVAGAAAARRVRDAES